MNGRTPSTVGKQKKDVSMFLPAMTLPIMEADKGSLREIPPDLNVYVNPSDTEDGMMSHWARGFA